MNGIKVTAVDTTGAGDAFVGGLLNSMASDPDIYMVLSSLFAIIYYIIRTSVSVYKLNLD